VADTPDRPSALTESSAEPCPTDPGTATGNTLWQMLQRRVELTPDRLMLVDEHDRRATFAEVAARAERVAAGLLELGIEAGTVVSWQLPNRIDTVVLSMALSRIGAVQNPIIHLYRQREVGSLLRTTTAQWFVVPRTWNGFDYLAMAKLLQAAVPTDRRPFSILVADDGLPEAEPGALPPAPASGDEVTWLYSTSGTTSEPKAVRHTDRSLIAAGVGIAKRLAIRGDDMGSIPYPYAHIGGPDYLVMMLRTGLPAVMIEVFAPAVTYPLFRRHGVTLTGGSTAHYQALLADQMQHPHVPTLPRLRQLSGGGAHLPPEIFWRLDEFGVTIRHGYGMTECPMISNGDQGDTAEQLANTAGRPVDCCEVLIVDAAERPVAVGVDGDILVRGPMLAKGYLDPVATELAFRADGYFRTGDRGHVRPDGHVVITGRTKELIIRKGENISPREIEDVLITHPSVAAVAVIGLPDDARGERVCAIVETTAGTPALTLSVMSHYCREAGLMIQKIPEQLEVVDSLPRNPTLKILKRALVEMYS
jgi:cyclohexanecarboxylate-CoA ligase